MSARELDPAVWAAAYGTTYAQQAEAVRLAGAEGDGWINVERCRQVADDAVLSLHPDGFADKHESLDRIVRATTHPEALRPPLPLREPEPTPAGLLVRLGDVSPGTIVVFNDGSHAVRLAANLPRDRVDVVSLATGTIDEHDAATIVSLGAAG